MTHFSGHIPSLSRMWLYLQICIGKYTSKDEHRALAFEALLWGLQRALSEVSRMWWLVGAEVTRVLGLNVFCFEAKNAVFIFKFSFLSCLYLVILDLTYQSYQGTLSVSRNTIMFGLKKKAGSSHPEILTTVWIIVGSLYNFELYYEVIVFWKDPRTGSKRDGSAYSSSVTHQATVSLP